MIQTSLFTFNPFQENTYVVSDKATGEALIIDPGNSTPAEDERLFDHIAQQGLRPVMVVATHGHVDHVLGAAVTAERYGIPFACSGADRFLLDSSTKPGTLYGLKTERIPPIGLDLDHTERIRFGESELEIIPTPGHTPGHVCLYHRPTKELFSGDTLFRESIGRTDLQGGDYSWIMRSILDRLVPLGEEVHFYPGHGPDSTIGHEMLYNPFIVEVLNREVDYR